MSHIEKGELKSKLDYTILRKKIVQLRVSLRKNNPLVGLSLNSFANGQNSIY
jgi:hypothetical protein